MFKDKVIAITGAGSGIGRALAEEFALLGAQLALSDIDEAAVEAVIASLPANSRARAYALNVANRAAVEKFAEDVVRDFGTAHYIINNAGTSVFATVENQSIEEIEKVLAVNLWGVIYGTKAFLPIMLRQREGCIVNMSSVFGLVASPCSVSYNMSKFAVRELTETLWQELMGTGVRAVVVHPGGINTNIKYVPKAEKSGALELAVLEGNARKMTTLPRDAALAIIDGLRRGKPRLLVGKGSTALFWLSRLMPDRYGAILRRELGV
ncbi:SDR family oxidoreductase [Pseudomonas sp. TH10]|uniref:SDR family NAD(P)-dependent oxidoreductase n=1 Tax=Pseudomonas sp. TH10 TaxID=2796376 RepID=UPI00191127E0|nr:SDR family oxidoreductase [Pseudomonas sp. TH10]MBK5517245.1 SDR family oxidoreductase [Pseudomonas sp. TH10]